MQRVPVRELSEEMQSLVDAAAEGDMVVIVLDDEREVQLVPVERKKFRRRAGWARGEIVMSDDFDAPLPDFEEYMP